MGEVAADIRCGVIGCDMDRYQRRLQGLRDRGECRICGSPLDGVSHNRCRACLKKDAIEKRERYKRRKDMGLCPTCGLPLSEMDEGFAHHNRNACAPSRRVML